MRAAVSINWDKCNVSNARDTLTAWYSKFYFVTDHKILIKRFDDYLTPFRGDLILVAEYPYTDRVYRDSYYHFHAAKYREVSRNCFRVFVFEPDAPLTALPTVSDPSMLQDKFLGYFVLRPLSDHPFGRAMVSPKAFASHNFVSCLVEESCSFMGHTLTACAFPHESQDSETHTCAETAIWSVLEYFGNHFAEYRPVLPSEIIRALQTGSAHRLLPSKGLSGIEIARALQHLGHDTQTYAQDEMDGRKFTRYLHYLVESGIPVIVSLDLVNKATGRHDRHAVVVMGHANKNGLPLPPAAEERNGLSLIDTADISCDLVSIDDNKPPYALLSPDSSGERYDARYSATSAIKYYIVPLHKHIYMDVGGASDLVHKILWSEQMGLPLFFRSGQIIYRVLLTESRALKKWVLRDSNFDTIVRKVVLGTALPRFVWLCELSVPELYMSGKAIGFMVMDATSSVDEDALLLYLVNGRLRRFKDDGSMYFQQCEMLSFSQYRGNLKESDSFRSVK